MKTQLLFLAPAAAVLIAAAPLHADVDPHAIDKARVACANDDFDTFLVHLARAPLAAKRPYFGRKIEEKVNAHASRRTPQLTVRQVPGRRFAGFPLAMVNHHYVFARNGRPVINADGSLQFLQVESERGTAILTDYPVRVVTVTWRKIAYAPPKNGAHEGAVAGAYGDDGRLVFAATDKCWQLIDVYTDGKPAALRPLAPQPKR